MNDFIDVAEDNKEEYNRAVQHPLQSFEWGEFRKKTGIEVIRRAQKSGKKLANAFTLMLHKVPYFSYYVGYFPKGDLPNKEILDELQRIGKEKNCVYIQLEPNVKVNNELEVKNNGGKININSLIHNSEFIIQNSFHPLFTKYTFILDLTKNEEELLKNMHPKTRYNIRLAQKKGVTVEIDNSKKSFNNYLNLMLETTQRQKFYAHTPLYHKTLWQTLESNKSSKHGLTYHLLNAYYAPEDSQEKKLLTSWVLFALDTTLYYPYGASSREHRDVMASNLIAWEAILLGKKLGLKTFDMWGALGPNPDKNDPWYGFHRFKEGYGATLTEFVGSYDLIINKKMYEVLKIADKLRWVLLKLRRI